MTDGRCYVKSLITDTERPAAHILLSEVIVATLLIERRPGATSDMFREEATRMAGTKDEFMGSVKQGLGKLTGDEALEAEGAIQKTGGRAERKTAGAAHEIKGNVKKAAGDLLDSPTLQAEGEADKVRGKIERS